MERQRFYFVVLGIKHQHHTSTYRFWVEIVSPSGDIVSTKAERTLYVNRGCYSKRQKHWSALRIWDN
jgi:hypothetical protein